MIMKRTCLLACCAAISIGLSAFGQESEPVAELKLRTPSSESGGLSLGVDLPEPRKSIGDLMTECMGLVNEGRRLEALDRINEALEKYPANKQIKMTQSVILMKNYRYREAAEILEQLIERDPGDAALLNNAAWLYATADEPGVRSGERAVALAKQALMTAPLNYHIWSTLSEGYYISGNFQKSLQAAQEAMRLAARKNAESENLREYRSQITKNMRAMQTFSLVD